MGKGDLLRTIGQFNFLQIHLFQLAGARCFGNQVRDVQPIGSAGLPKVLKISKAVKLYLERAKAHETFLKDQIAEFEIGKRHLANMMGLDPENISQEDIDKAIEYLLPSGLFDKRSRPKLKHPLEILPKFKAAQFGGDGRPYHSFFYTEKQSYNECLHTISRKIEEVKKFEDEQISMGIKHDQSMQLSLIGSEWCGVKVVKAILEDVIAPHEYKTLILNLEYLSKLPYSHREKDFIFQFRLSLQKLKFMFNFEMQPLMYTEDGRCYAEAIGKRKKAVSSVKLFEKGTGKVSINGEMFLVYFPRLAEREQILFPLHLTDKLCKVDIEAKVEKGGPSGQAGAIRLAISRALQNFVSQEYVEKLSLAGLLTPDPRVLERNKPGYRGARAKPIWKKR